MLRVCAACSLFTRYRFLIAGLALVASCWLVACTDRSAIEQAERDVLSIHDDVMPNMDDLLRVQRQLTTRLASLDSTAGDGSAASTLRLDEDRHQARRLLHDLRVADSLMTHWMAQYRYDSLSALPTDDALRYLDQQRSSITDIKNKVNESLAHSRQFLAAP